MLMFSFKERRRIDVPEFLKLYLLMTLLYRTIDLEVFLYLQVRIHELENVYQK